METNNPSSSFSLFVGLLLISLSIINININSKSIFHLFKTFLCLFQSRCFLKLLVVKASAAFKSLSQQPHGEISWETFEEPA